MGDSMSMSGGISFTVKMIIGILMLIMAYFLFRYAWGSGDWDFIIGPIKSLFGTV